MTDLTAAWFILLFCNRGMKMKSFRESVSITIKQLTYSVTCPSKQICCAPSAEGPETLKTMTLKEADSPGQG